MKKILKFIRINYIKIIIILIPILLFSMIILFSIKVKQNSNTLKIEKNSFYQYFVGNKLNYNGKLTIDKNSKIVNFKINDKPVSLFSSPIYYTNESKIIFSNDMSFVSYKNNIKQYFIQHFTKLYKNNDNYYFLELANKKQIIKDTFLYDGDDLYVFMESTHITIDNVNYDLDPLSYVIVNYREQIEIYNYGCDSGTIIPIGNSDVYAYSGDLKLNLSVDSVESNGKSVLLYKKINDLPKLGGWK